MEYFYWTEDGDIRGPLSLAELAKLGADEQSRTLVCGEGQNAWRPLVELVPGGWANGEGFGPRPISPQFVPAENRRTPLTQAEARRGEEVRGNATLPNAGWLAGVPLVPVVAGSAVCLFLGVGGIWLPGRLALICAPLFFMAVVLGVAALACARNTGTVILLSMTLLAPPVEWFFMTRRASVAPSAVDVNTGTPPRPAVPNETIPETPATPLNVAAVRPADSPDEGHSRTPEPKDAGTGAGRTMEAMRRQFDVVVQESAAVDRKSALKAQSSVDGQPVDAPPSPTPRRLPEKTWDKPHVYIQICDETQRPTAELIKKELQNNGDVVMNIDNVHDHPSVPPEASEVRYIVSDDTEESEKIASTVRQFMSGNKVVTASPVPETPYVSHSRQYEIWLSKSFRPLPMISRLDPAVVNRWTAAQVQTAIDEIYARHGANFPRKKDQEWAERQSWYHAVPGLTHDGAEQSFTAEERADVELLAGRREAITKGQPPQPAAHTR